MPCCGRSAASRPATSSSTKVDPLPGSADFSGDRVRRSVEESLDRLGPRPAPAGPPARPRADLVRRTRPPRTARCEALLALRDEGVVGLVGVAGGPVAMMERFVRLGVFDAARDAQPAHAPRPVRRRAARRGRRARVARLQRRALRRRRPGPATRSPATPSRTRTARRRRSTSRRGHAIGAACARHGVPVPARRARSSSTRDPRVAVDDRRRDPAAADRRRARLGAAPGPADLWDELAGAGARTSAPWLGPDGR